MCQQLAGGLLRESVSQSGAVKRHAPLSTPVTLLAAPVVIKSTHKILVYGGDRVTTWKS